MDSKEQSQGVEIVTPVTLMKILEIMKILKSLQESVDLLSLRMASLEAAVLPGVQLGTGTIAYPGVRYPNYPPPGTSTWTISTGDTTLSAESQLITRNV